MSIRVLITDDQALVRAGFHMILAAQDDMEVVGEASNGIASVELARRLLPHVVLMDIRMPSMDGIEATRRITAFAAGRAPRVVILTTYDLDEYVFEALAAGACGFLLKDVPPEDLVRGVRIAAAGDSLLAPSVTRRLVEEFVRRPRAGSSAARRLEGLTEREVEVLRLLARGLSNAEIAGGCPGLQPGGARCGGGQLVRRTTPASGTVASSSG